ncbi:MAG TPA: hypothetical protein VK864_01025 [Longimicrobiales bacterium]|nr:hypothetical protein [Longimicrobiales bacterium]
MSRAHVRRWLLPLFAALALAGCGALVRSYDVTPAGLARGDAQLRQLLESGSADTALLRFDQPKKQTTLPTDDLLRLLYRGVVAYHAGHYDSSGTYLDRAAQLVEERQVFRISREAAALITNDRALPWQPLTTERLLLPYYAALSYVRRNDLNEAAVEARRLSHALEALDEKPGAVTARLRGFLRYFAGAVFEAAGATNDAAVAYRNARRLLGDSIVPVAAATDSGDVIVLLEEGFVAHRIEQSVTIALAHDEADWLLGDDQKRRDATASTVAARALAQVLSPAAVYNVGPRVGKQHWFIPAPERTQEPKPECKTEKADSAAAQEEDAKSDDCDHDHDRDFYILRLAWPAYHAVSKPTLHARVALPDSSSLEMPWFVSVSDAVVNDFTADRGRILARSIARAAAKFALTKGAQESAGKKNEDLGRALGAIANVSGALLDQADTRSWTLLPGGIGLARVRLPAGRHRLALDIDGGNSSTSRRRLDLGEVQVRGGELGFITARMWQ